MDKPTARRNAYLMLITGLILLGIGIYFIVTEFQAQAPDWYYWLGLIVVGDLFLIAGVRQLKRTEK
ncbi:MULTISPECIES: hypothetical protein [Altibacter]|uniref:hypothetical protein n=1 Tax=Altibacter TaxID=1535231 RepID=UPI00054D30B3|nr:MULTISPECIES: hypothetical protein [Altibacter]MCW8980602.1 hypothetical protein [Altibacter sp.]MCW9037081.1 hypothetical protein [Altibacter sp.]